ncbi:hypothetical protein TrCOL_g12435 [Triparma columacea]|uniref:RING-type domain-containing protein n=1 Tax=Triparma columacea TaxID=722753 RepID=A0A9W7LA33_9STRA|nr:hypothetical protein TrCOL_g12435 [Triparma columacea]
MRKVKSGQGGLRRVIVKAEGMRREVEEAKRRFGTVGARLNQIEAVRTSLERRNMELEARLGSQRESIARLGRFQRNAEFAEGKIEMMRNVIQAKDREKEGLEGEISALSAELEEWKARERRVRRRVRDLEGEEGKEGGEEEEQGRGRGRGRGRQGEGDELFNDDGRVNTTAVAAATSEARLKEIEANLDYSLGVVRRRREEVIRSMASTAGGGSGAAQKLCCVCMEVERQVLLMPCRHLCVCRGCSEDERLRDCPICRSEVLERMVVYS